METLALIDPATALVTNVIVAPSLDAPIVSYLSGECEIVAVTPETQPEPGWKYELGVFVPQPKVQDPPPEE